MGKIWAPLLAFALILTACNSGSSQRDAKQSSPPSPELSSPPSDGGIEFKELQIAEALALTQTILKHLPGGTYHGHLDDGRPCSIEVQLLNPPSTGLAVALSTKSSPPPTAAEAALQFDISAGQIAAYFVNESPVRLSVEGLLAHLPDANSLNIEVQTLVLSLGLKPDGQVASVYIFDSKKAQTELSALLCRVP